MIRSTLAASLCLSVIVACDGRGVVQMKAHQYTAAERAKSREMLGLRGGEKTETLTSRFHRERRPEAAAKLADAPKGSAEEAEVQPTDKALSKSFWEKIDQAGTQAATNVANLRALIAKKLGVVEDAVLNRIAGISIENKSQFSTTMFDLHAIVSLRGRDQALHLYNQTLSPADAKDLVYGTSKVEVKNFNASNVEEKNITTEELLVSAFCIEPDDKACKRAYLTIQLGQNTKGEWITGVFELDAQLNIVSSNIRVPGLKEVSYYEALERLSKMTQEDLSSHNRPSAHIEAIKRENAQPPTAQVLRKEGAPVSTKNDLLTISRGKPEPFQFKPVEPAKSAGPRAAAPAPAKPVLAAETPAAAPTAPARLSVEATKAALSPKPVNMTPRQDKAVATPKPGPAPTPAAAAPANMSPRVTPSTAGPNASPRVTPPVANPSASTASNSSVSGTAAANAPAASKAEPEDTRNMLQHIWSYVPSIR